MEFTFKKCVIYRATKCVILGGPCVMCNIVRNCVIDYAKFLKVGMSVY